MAAGAVLIGSALVSAAAGVAGMLMKPKVPKATPQPTVNRAAEEAQKRDMLARRRTPAADMLLGAGGAESSTGLKTSLGT